jgi:four helix bundle protein
MGRPNFLDLKVYQLSEQLSDAIGDIVLKWEPFHRNTTGEQLVRSADSVGANIAEGHGRGSFKDNKRHVYIARGSLYETQHWLRRAFQRKLLTPEVVSRLKPILDELNPKLNAYLKKIGKRTPHDAPPPKG